MRANGTVIAYHAVGSCPKPADPENLFTPVERFEEQMAFLADRHDVVPLEDIVRGSAGKRAVAITFDDGFKSVLSTAAPILRRYRFTATVFVPSRWIGGRSTAWYDARGCETELMTGHELQAAEEEGIEVGSHGSAHLDFGRLSRAEAEADLDASIVELTAVLGRPPRYFAYPFGRYSAEAKRAAADRFDAAFSIDLPHDGPFAHERVGITRLDGKLVFAVKASGRYLALRRSRLGATAYALVRPVVSRARRARA
jgi:peptidoglycan/xylan/chitin deacetylase (PgdA/CDA1 family)